MLSKTRHETVFEADPIDLQILRTRPREGKKRGAMNAFVNYILTPSSSELTPFNMLTYMGTGAVRSKTVRKFAFTLVGRRRLDFVKRYHHEARGDEDVAWRQLSALHNRTMARAEFGRVDGDTLAALDDFLALVTFASRYRVACVGVDAFSEHGDHFTFYRKNVTAPPFQKQDRNDAVIDLSDFEKFIRQAYPRFMNSDTNGPNELLRHALHLVKPEEDRTVESAFTTLYAALETLVLWHRRRVGLEWIIEDADEWNQLREDLGKFLKEHPLTKDNKESRKLIRSKLGELRRAPFSAAFERFCADYAVDLTDLWPVVGKASDMPLSEIRNHIVHGSVLEWSQWLALGDAREHLRWTVERMLLGVFGWNVGDSKVRPDWLARNTAAMAGLRSAREAMMGLSAVPTSISGIETESQSL
jgi:hypothetical protein